jgi:hypothetical protein
MHPDRRNSLADPQSKRRFLIAIDATRPRRERAASPSSGAQSGENGRHPAAVAATSSTTAGPPVHPIAGLTIDGREYLMA